MNAIRIPWRQGKFQISNDFQVHKNVLFAKLIWTSFRFNDAGKAILVIYVRAKNFAKHKNSKLLPPILLSKLLFQKDTADLTCGFVYSWHTTEFPKSRHAPGFKGHRRGDTALSHRNTVNVSPRLCSGLRFPPPTRGKDISASGNRNKIPTLVTLFLCLLSLPSCSMTLDFPSVPKAKRKSNKPLCVKGRNKASFSHHNEYPALGRSDPTGGTLKWYSPSREQLSNTYQTPLEWSHISGQWSRHETLS